MLTRAPSLPCRGLSAPQLTSKKVVYFLLWVSPCIFMHIKLNRHPGSKPGGATAELTHQIPRKVPEPTCLPAQGLAARTPSHPVAHQEQPRISLTPS